MPPAYYKYGDTGAYSFYSKIITATVILISNILYSKLGIFEDWKIGRLEVTGRLEDWKTRRLEGWKDRMERRTE